VPPSIALPGHNERGGHGSKEAVVGELRVAADRQRARLLEWAARFEPRRWAIEGATGMGALLAQQLAQDRLVGGGGVATVELPLERADDVPPLAQEAIAPPLPTGYGGGHGLTLGRLVLL
jgi:hypothetical protein